MEDQKKELISIIVPVYNTAEFIDKCLESLTKQTYRNIEIILVDDGSTDDSGEICEKWRKIDPRIIVIHKENFGVSSARNVGFDYSKGKYIAYVDSDDCVSEDMVEQLLRLCLDYSINMSCISYLPFTDEFDCISSNGDDFIFSSSKVIEELTNPNTNVQITYSVWGKLFKRDIIEHLRFPEGKVYEEIKFITEALFAAGGCAYSSKICYYYRLRNGSITNSKYEYGFDMRIIEDKYSIQLEQIKYLGKNFPEEIVLRAKCYYFEELYTIYHRIDDTYLKSRILKCMKSFMIRKIDLLKLEIPAKRKMHLIIKMIIFCLKV